MTRVGTNPKQPKRLHLCQTNHSSKRSIAWTRVGLGILLTTPNFSPLALAQDNFSNPRTSAITAPGTAPVYGPVLPGNPETGPVLTRPADSRSTLGPAPAPVPQLAPNLTPLKIGGPGQYVLEFNRSPIVGSRLQLRGIYDEARLRFTRPRNWKSQDAKILLRFRHSPALYATRSNLTVLLNGTSVGSVPLNYKQGEIGEAIYTAPAHLIQDYNEIVVAALQNNSPTCTQDPYDPSLWTEVMPDSKLVLQFAPQPFPLNFAQYPYPFFDELSLEPNRIAYLVPNQIDSNWLTAIARFEASLGRFARYRPLETRLVRSSADVKPDERLIVIGTAKTQPELANLNLPLTLNSDGKLTHNPEALAKTKLDPAQLPPPELEGTGIEGTGLEADGLEADGLEGAETDLNLNPEAEADLETGELAPSETTGETFDPITGEPIAAPTSPPPKPPTLTKTDGLLMAGTLPGGKIPVLVITAQDEASVAKAVQMLIQSRDREIGTGQAIVVNQLRQVAAPDPRDWPSYLPLKDNFQLKDLLDYNEQPYQDTTVRGAQSPPIEFDFKALPDDKFLSGNQLYLTYSYGPQVNPLTSLLEVKLDGLPLLGRKLDDAKGRSREVLQVTLPENKIKPNSKLQVLFQLDPRERRSCNRATDQQLWGTVHAETGFELRRENEVTLPSLALLQSGFPFAAPQDLSRTALVVPQDPTDNEILLLLEVAERLGRLSRSEAIALQAYPIHQLPNSDRNNKHLIALGTHARFPFPRVLQGQGFSLLDGFQRRRDNSQIQTLPDAEGVIREILSPWNRDRVLLMLTAQQATGLDRVRDVFSRDGLFFQLKEDTALISSKGSAVSSYNPRDYLLEFLERAPETRQVSETKWREQLQRTFTNNWLFLIPGTLLAAAFLYGIAQAYLQRQEGTTPVASSLTDTSEDSGQSELSGQIQPEEPLTSLVGSTPTSREEDT